MTSDETVDNNNKPNNLDDENQDKTVKIPTQGIETTYINEKSHCFFKYYFFPLRSEGRLFVG